MELRVRDVAKLLDMSEDDVQKLVKRRALPGHRIDGEYRFNRVELQEWAATHGHRVSPKLFAAGGPDDEPLPKLHEALARGGIHYDVPGRRREEVLAAVTKLPGIPSTVDRKLLEQLLVGRETLASTAIGEGIAIPHPRDPLVVRVSEPIVVLGFLRNPVDFKAVDDRPVRIVFVLLSHSVRQHLQILSRLAFVLHDPDLKALLEGSGPAETILNRIRDIEAEVWPGSTTSPSPAGDGSGGGSTGNPGAAGK